MLVGRVDFSKGHRWQQVTLLVIFLVFLGVDKAIDIFAVRLDFI